VLQFYYPTTTTTLRSLKIGLSETVVASPHVLMPPATTPWAKIANRVLAASRPSFGGAFGLQQALRRRTIALRRR
jgi:hypothetical protein